MIPFTYKFDFFGSSGSTLIQARIEHAPRIESIPVISWFDEMWGNTRTNINPFVTLEIDFNCSYLDPGSLDEDGFGFHNISNSVN